ncbi:DUF1097 domain-containing protein [Flagellimonas eckloniae]|uniref:DUF1097 domain-containing protein n=1 Tax=Flagellimonas eckloniae TaxID=346185 RepID=A0A0N8WGG4_9FLAO|nr:DUF1097 domain-containing protein [Allomuricauda eckloniae]KQC31427.1 hypothetical protein AAY42_17265 [Allomuricauda eckloniae]
MKTFLTALVMGLCGALAVFISFSMGWATWVMFLAWISYYLFGKSIKVYVPSFLQIILGILLGVLIQSMASLLVPAMGAMGFPLTVFVLIGSLAYVTKINGLNNIPAWFLGLIIFFGVHPELQVIPVLGLLVPIVTGVIFALINDTGLKYINTKF